MTDDYAWEPYVSITEPQHADEEAAEYMQRELIRTAAESIGVEFDERHVTAATWDLANMQDTWHSMWRFQHRIDSELVARVAAAARQL